MSRNPKSPWLRRKWIVFHRFIKNFWICMQGFRMNWWNKSNREEQKSQMIMRLKYLMRTRTWQLQILINQSWTFAYDFTMIKIYHKVYHFIMPSFSTIFLHIYRCYSTIFSSFSQRIAFKSVCSLGWQSLKLPA